MLKKKGMKTTGKKSTLMKRLHMRGGVELMPGAEGANEQGNADVDKALAPSEEDFASPPPPPDAKGAPMEEKGGKRRRRSRRREEGGKRRRSRRGEMLGY